MIENKTLRRSLVSLVALAIFAMVSIACFQPLLEGRTLPMHDIEQFDGMSRDIREHRAEFGEDPQWTGAMFGGMPAYMINIKYPSQILKGAADATIGRLDSPAGLIFLAMAAAFFMMLMIGYSPWVGIVAGLAYGLSTYFTIIIGAGHITKMWALIYAPLMLGAIYMTLRRNMWLGGALASLFAALEIGANHIQITYYFLLVALLLWLNDLAYAAIERRLKEFAKRTGVLLAAAVLALAANFAPLYYAASHTKDTMRGGSELAEKSEEKEGLNLAYATQWSYGKAESWNMLFPDFMGGDSAKTFSGDGAVAKTIESEFGYPTKEAAKKAKTLPTYWGEQPYTAGPTYIGAVALFLALLGLLLASNRNRWWILAATILGLLLSWGSNLMPLTEFCFKYLPFYNKFRTVSMALVIVELTAPLLAGMALYKLFKASDMRMVRIKLIIATATMGGIALFFALFGGDVFDFSSSLDAKILGKEAADILKGAMAQERAALLTADAWRSLILILLTAGVVFLFTFKDRIIKEVAVLRSATTNRIAVALITLVVAALVVVDIAPVNKRYLPDEKFVEPRTTTVKPTAADRRIMADKEPGFRVLNTTVDPMQDASTSMFHRSVGGYHGAKLGRYQDFMGYLGSNGEAYNMLNTKYIIYANQTGAIQAEQNPATYGAAWFVDHVFEAKSAAEELETVAKLASQQDTVSNGACLRYEAVVAEHDIKAARTTESDGTGYIALKEYRPNYLRYEYELVDGDATAIFSEIYYDKGWTAYIDGVEAPYFRANYILRGMRLPKGKHTVEWRFRAPHWQRNSAMTLCGSILILLALVGAALHTLGLDTRLYNLIRKLLKR